MLVIARKPNGERILIGENIEITIMKFKNGSVRVGINAPVGIPVTRQEPKEGFFKNDKVQVQDSSRVKVGSTTSNNSKKSEVRKKRIRKGK